MSKRLGARALLLVGRVPRAAWICALVACLNAACWSVITPPFQVPDEPSHFAYVEHLVETGKLQTSVVHIYPEEESEALLNLNYLEVRNHPENHPIATEGEQRTLEQELSGPLRRSAAGTSSPETSKGPAEPPLYYALQTIPYLLGSGGTILDRLELMRLLSALMAGLTALFVYLFIREALPGAPWGWAVGGLSVALLPLLGFMSGAVNNDALLYAVSAAIFYLLARAFRRGLTPQLAVAIGVVSAIGLLTKPNFIGLLPGVLVGLVMLALRAARTDGRTAYQSLGVAVGIPASLVCLYIIINLFSHVPGLGAVSTGVHHMKGGLFKEISYIWQLYLPRLPGMGTDFPGFSTTSLWFNRSVGLYGWLDTSFPVWLDRIALILVGLLAILGIHALITVRATLRRRLAELAAYAVMGVGLLALVGAAQYTTKLAGEAAEFFQPRYLLPLAPLLGAALALSARGAGRRWGKPVGTLIVVLFLTYDVFSQLQVISRYYG